MRSNPGFGLRICSGAEIRKMYGKLCAIHVLSLSLIKKPEHSGKQSRKFESRHNTSVNLALGPKR